jgi:hypothetical protein
MSGNSRYSWAMRSWTAAFLLLSLLAPPAHAQDSPTGEDAGEENPYKRMTTEDVERQRANETDAPQTKEESHPDVTVVDARDNIASLIQSFMARRMIDGAWPLRDKKTGLTRRLTLAGVEEKKTSPATGDRRFKAPATLKDAESGELLPAEFVADFTGPDWKIVGMRLLPAKPAKTAKRAAAKADKPEAAGKTAKPAKDAAADTSGGDEPPAD